MKGKYTTRTAYFGAYLKRALLRAFLHDLIRWNPLCTPGTGYTIIIACHGPLATMALPSIEFLAKQDLAHLQETIVSFDRPEQTSLVSLAMEIQRRHPRLRPRFIFQSAREARTSRRIGWGWVDCWLSYAKGIAEAQTQYAILHDMDCMLLRPDLMEERYRLIAEAHDHFLGTEWYEGNGIVPGDRLAYIVEMALDVAFVRKECHPLDLFNVIGRLEDRWVDFDTLLYPQTRTQRRSMVPVAEEDMVHPSQVVSQYTLLARPSYRPHPRNNALFIPYFYYLAGNQRALTETTRSIQSSGPRIVLLGRPLDLSRQTTAHADWLLKQATRIENALAGSMRAEPAEYFQTIRKIAARNELAV